MAKYQSEFYGQLKKVGIEGKIQEFKLKIQKGNAQYMQKLNGNRANND
jgi:hypothetical protein